MTSPDTAEDERPLPEVGEEARRPRALLLKRRDGLEPARIQELLGGPGDRR